MWTGALAAGELELERGSVVVCVLVDAEDGFPSLIDPLDTTLSSVAANTNPATPLLLVGSEAGIARAVKGRGLGPGDTTRQVHTLTLVEKDGETEAFNAAVHASCPADLALVRIGVEVASGWLTGLRAAALSDCTVASATPLSLGVGGVELLDDAGESHTSMSGERLARTATLAREAERVSARCLRLWPRIATIGPGCAYIRRGALELLGPLDGSLGLDDALADLAARAIGVGMAHAAADDVLVMRSPDSGFAPVSSERSLGSDGEDGRDGVERIARTLARDERGRLSRALGIARAALRPLSVTIDGRSLTSVVGGTQTYVLELIAALAREGDVALRVLVPHDLSVRAKQALDDLPDLELLSYDEALKEPPLSDVVHRPQQAFTADDLALLRLVGRRVVIGQQDLIAYHNYSYHQDIERWRAYRRTTRLALAVADQVVFFSEHARRDALAEDLLPAERTHVVGVGAEAVEPEGREIQPGGVPGDRPFLLCMGADYAHKNRPFAIELIGALGELGWQGCLVLAGSHVPVGSSREAESELLERDPALRDRVIDVGPVDEPGKRWLYRHARALLYPTLYEGFGLLPLEAARAGLPCLFAAQASLAELAGRAATLRPWDPKTSAAAVLPLLADRPAREEHLARLRGLELPSWREVAQQLSEVYRRAVAEPSSEAAPRAWQELDREIFIASLDADIAHLKSIAQEYQDAYHSLRARVAHGLPLIDEGGLLTTTQQRGLMRIASRRLSRALILAPLSLLGRAGASRRLNGDDRSDRKGLRSGA